jgi:hypothetical protein
MTPKKVKNKIKKFHVLGLDVQASPVAWTAFMKAMG